MATSSFRLEHLEPLGVSHKTRTPSFDSNDTIPPFEQYQLSIRAIDTPYPSTETWMHGTSVPNSPLIRINDNTDFRVPSQSQSDFSFRSTFGIPQDWQMYQGQHGGVGAALLASQFPAISREYRGHARQASDSTIASAGPDSPYTNFASYPYIANTDRSPTSATYPTEDTSANFAKSSGLENFNQFPVGYMPSQLSHTPAAHMAMKNMAIDHHNTADEVPEYASSRRSESSHGRNSPSTPHTGDESDDRTFKHPPGEFLIPTSNC